ncbi:methyl-accepting chemotaxis protein [Ideonella dechloratans]|uniref:methyl-accepting chemotaxis protein n=1 Tax=Ideonella dechloratans TaxID=36863 RepID=UPI001E62A484|nr:methyl-accepting chemotaxis protein [Ideonella dechloratans]UFU10697.1 methyl-accepting chemotaxis protein [Ideonella dechloratans]
MPSRFHSLRLRLVAACGALVLLSLLVLAAVNQWTARRAALQNLTGQTLSLGHAHAAAIAEWMAQHRAVVESIGPAARDADPVPRLQQADKAGGFDTTYFGYADKRIVFSKPQDLPAGYDPTARPWYTSAAAGQGVVITEPYVDASTKKLVITFAQALREGGAVSAVAAGDVYMDGVSRSVASIRPTPHSFGFIVAKDGKVMVHEDVSKVLQPAVQLSPALADAGASADTLTEARIGDRAVLLGRQPIEGTDWTLVIALDRDEALAGVNAMLWQSLLGSLLLAGLAVAVVGGLIAARLRRLTLLRDAMRDVASGEGDLTRRIPADGHDELADIAGSFNRFVDKLQHTLRDIRGASESVRVASQEIANGNHDLSSRTESMASSLQQTASSMEQMTAQVGYSADTATQANQLAVSAAEAAQRGGDVVSQVVDSMNEISGSSRRMAEIIGVIDGIAFQTNILALNAAVEAARAGEQGRGFAVVASEVRQLAQRSAAAAKEIKGLIDTSTAHVASGAERVGRTGEVMQEIVGSVRRVSDLIGEIASAATEQRDGIGQVNQAVSQLDQVTQQNAALVEQSAAAASSLKEQAHRLAEAVGTFRIGEGR